MLFAAYHYLSKKLGDTESVKTPQKPPKESDDVITARKSQVAPTCENLAKCSLTPRSSSNTSNHVQIQQKSAQKRSLPLTSSSEITTQTGSKIAKTEDEEGPNEPEFFIENQDDDSSEGFLRVNILEPTSFKTFAKTKENCHLCSSIKILFKI